MRSMDDEVDVVAVGQDYLSEDEHSPTDASEDSVEVRVSTIKAPRGSRGPARLLGVDSHFELEAIDRFHKLKRHYAALKENLNSGSVPNVTKERYSPALSGATSPLLHHAPSDFPPSPSPAAENLHAGPPPPPLTSRSPRPLSPATASRASKSRRKPAEPRRLCPEADQREAIKRPLEDEEDPERRLKAPKTSSDDYPSASRKLESPSAGLPPNLQPHPVLSPLTRPPPGLLGFPPLPFPPTWTYPYSRLVPPLVPPPLGLLSHAGLAPGLSSSHYSVVPLVPGHYPHLARPLFLPTAAAGRSPPPPPMSPVPLPAESEAHPVRTMPPADQPLPLIKRSVHPPPPPPPPPPSQASEEVSHEKYPEAGNSSGKSTKGGGVGVRRTGKSTPKFLSVESLLSVEDGRGPPQADDELSQPEGGGPSQVPGSEALLSLKSEDDIHALLQQQPKQKQRNYKNMTRERRIEANARERTRVHTISAAFEKLRQSVPSYSHNQKLSKLSILRIACSYILSLSRLAGHDYSPGQTAPSFGECVDLTTKTIQIEGKAKKKRDE
ncbi:atonal bHLH transcription factor 8-like protein net [Oratosquilla oratoria]|uniref:atonal bHLH transcription factor 8-like protein net n=1 Tax=Oratosquilla oratoria TaxID=337810 RepID=UPI003F767EE3